MKINNKSWRIYAGSFLIAGSFLYYYLQAQKNWEGLRAYTLQVRLGYLCFSFGLFMFVYLLDVYIWQVCLNRNRKESKISEAEIVAMLGVSDMLRYVPGKILGILSQWHMLKKHSISKSEVLYVNLIYFIGSITVSLYLCVIYFLMNTDAVRPVLVIGIAMVLLIANVIYIIYNNVIINNIIVIFNEFAKTRLRPYSCSRWIILNIQAVCIFSALLSGISGYYLLRGVAIPVSPRDILILLISINISWLVSHFAVIAPRGLGVREGAMLMILKRVVSVETALIFPLLFRALVTIADLTFVSVAIIIGLRKGVLTPGHADRE